MVVFVPKMACKRKLALPLLKEENIVAHIAGSRTSLMWYCISHMYEASTDRSLADRSEGVVHSAMILRLSAKLGASVKEVTSQKYKRDFNQAQISRERDSVSAKPASVAIGTYPSVYSPKLNVRPFN
jgi:hypothetical protein